VQRILADISVKAGEELAVLVNGLGATSLAELFIIFRAASHVLRESTISIWRSYVGNYATSLDMAGASVSFMRLDTELKRWMSAPAETPALVQV